MARKKKGADGNITKETKAPRISVNDLDNIMTEINSKNEEVVIWNNLEVHIRKRIPLKDVLTFVRDAANSCFSKDTHEYMPEIRDFAIRMNVIETYANFNLPANLSKRYDVVMNSGAYEMILDHVDIGQIDQIITAIDARIENMATANVEMVNMKLNDLITNFNRLYETLDGVFSGVSKEDMQGVITAFSNAQFSDEGLVKAFKAQKHGE